MASSFINSTSGAVAALLNKLRDPDPDFRFMSLNDLLAVLNSCRPEFLVNNTSLAAQCADAIIAAVDDSNGEVQNMAIRCLSPLSQKAPGPIISPMLAKLLTLELKNSMDVAVPALALRTVISSLPSPAPGVPVTQQITVTYEAIIGVVLPYLIGLTPNQPPSGPSYSHLPNTTPTGSKSSRGIIPDTVDVLIEVIRRFGILMSENVVSAAQQYMSRLLQDDSVSAAAKRRGVIAISVLSVHLSDNALVSMLDGICETLSRPDVSATARRNYLSILGSIARSISNRLGRHLQTLVPHVLRPLEEEELRQLRQQIEDGTPYLSDFNEVRESALVALEAFLSACPAEMEPFIDSALDSALRYLKFDPNSAIEDDNDRPERETDEDDEPSDDEFSDDEVDYDDDDTSWKVRRCSAKVIAALIDTRAHDLLDNGVLYERAAPALIKQLDERQENVRLEVIAALDHLVRSTGDRAAGNLGRSLDDYDLEVSSVAMSRKRRRQSSGELATIVQTGLASPSADTLPATGPHANLNRLIPVIVKRSRTLLRGKSIPTKQAVMKLLDNIVFTQRSAVGDALGGVMGAIIDIIQSGGPSATAMASNSVGSNASATTTTLRMATLKLVADIAKTHSTAVLKTHLPQIVSVVVHAMTDRFYKVSSEAVQTAQELAKVITPPRSRANGFAFKSELNVLYMAVMARISSGEVDLEVRQRALHALAIILARTSSLDSSWLSTEHKSAGLALILDRLKNETTRLACVRAIDTILSTAGSLQFGPQWTRTVALELASQLRKANRPLKVSSIVALRRLLATQITRNQLDTSCIETIVAAVLPGINQADSLALGPSLLILASVALDHPDVVGESQVTNAVCQLLTSTHVGIVLEQVMAFVVNIGSSGRSQPLMTALLQEISISGDPKVIGKVIGALVVSSGLSAGVTVDNFVTELKSSSKADDDRRVCLALTVLGEVGMRLGHKSPVKPSLFQEHFHQEPNKVSLAAATALGRAGSSNSEEFLPAVLQMMGGGGSMQYLSIVAINEMLKQTTDLAQYSLPIWEHVLQASNNTESRVISAECIARLVIMEPSFFMPKLQALLKDQHPSVRAVAVQAVRYSLSENDERFDHALKDVLVEMLLVMIQDSDMDIRRLAMTTLNSAAHNKSEFLAPSVHRIMPFVFSETVINPALIREVKLGPFMHIVDDGLELRKSAYDTLYALLETVSSQIPTKDLFDRIIAGLSDDNDIRSLCNLMIAKLINLQTEETFARLDDMADNFRKTLSVKLKDTAVKQELEKQEEASKGALRVTLVLADRLKSMSSGSASDLQATTGPGLSHWAQYWDWVQRRFDPQIKIIREEARSLQTAST